MTVRGAGGTFGTRLTSGTYVANNGDLSVLIMMK